jgi:hypothetical protein
MLPNKAENGFPRAIAGTNKANHGLVRGICPKSGVLKATHGTNKAIFGTDWRTW